jgi:hypothetical protein
MKIFSILHTQGSPDRFYTVWNGKGKFDANTQTMQVSNYMMLQGVDWIDLKTNDLGFLQDVLNNGYFCDGRRWVVAFANPKDSRDGRAILVPADGEVSCLEDLDILVHSKDYRKVAKAVKYVGRLMAPLPKGKVMQVATVLGEETITQDGVTFPVLSLLMPNGKPIKIVFDDMEWMDPETKAVSDGHLSYQEGAWAAVGRTGYKAHRDTWGTNWGVLKGHSQNNGQPGIYVWASGPKPLVTTKLVVFGDMGELHAGNPHTDIQSWVNFGYDRAELGPALARKFMKETADAARNYRKMQRLLLRYVFNPVKSQDPTQDSYLLRDILALDIPILSNGEDENFVPGYPALWRRAVALVMKQVMQCEEGRVPMHGVAENRYFMPDPAISSAPYGKPNLALSDLEADELGAVGLVKGTVVIVYRQPNEHSNAWYRLTTTSKPRFAKYGKGVCFLGCGAVLVLLRLGGGDMDDSGVVIYDPVWVNGFMTLEVFPEVGKLQDATEDVAPDHGVIRADLEAVREFFASGFDLKSSKDKPFGYYQYQDAIDLVKGGGVSLGQAVNYCMIELTLLRPSHRDGVRKQLEGEALLAYNQEVAEYDAGTHPLSIIASNLERLIDGTVKDSSLLIPLTPHLEAVPRFHENTRYYPACLRGKIPAIKQEAGGYVLIETNMCLGFKKIAEYRGILEELFSAIEWTTVGPADKRVLDEYPSSKAARTVIAEIKEIWHAEWTDRFDKGLGEAELSEAYRKIEGLVNAVVLEYDPEERKAIAVEGYRQCYRRRYEGPKVRPETGEVKNYWDAWLWTEQMGKYLLLALQQTLIPGAHGKPRPITGRAVAVELFPQFIGLWESDVEVYVTAGTVTRISDEELLGFIDPKVPAANYLMEGGLIITRKNQLGHDRE